jgi:hypothetical protein
MMPGETAVYLSTKIASCYFLAYCGSFPDMLNKSIPIEVIFFKQDTHKTPKPKGILSQDAQFMKK